MKRKKKLIKMANNLENVDLSILNRCLADDSIGQYVHEHFKFALELNGFLGGDD